MRGSAGRLTGSAGGKPFIATHPDRICPTDKPTVLVDCGAVCAALEKAVGRGPDVVLGKPDPCMLRGILHRHALAPEHLAMVGDRLYTDMAMARKAGALGVLVLTGETTAAAAARHSPAPDLVVSGLAEFGERLRAARRAAGPGGNGRLYRRQRSRMPINPSAKRQAALRSLQSGPLDVLIIGGGIVGSGVARDAAMRGLRVGLVEQHDFASGTSSRSSRLLHGGLRYLAQGRIGLVHEASVEKKVIHQIAPHLADPLPFIFPTYGGNRDWVLWQLKIGVKVYDLLCAGRNLGKSTWLSQSQVLERVPGLAQDGLKGAVRYYDGFTNDARLTIDTLRSAAASGAVVLNYCRFKDAARTDLWECQLDDRLARRGFNVRARAVVNATGPWADGLPHSRVKLRLTKGIHLVVERTRMPVSDTVVMTEGKRILFVIPWGERTILGTTDTDYDGPLDDVRADATEIAYVLKVTNQFFPATRLTQRDLISAWAGLRPLLADPKGEPSDISRAHEIHSPEPGWWDVAGGSSLRIG